jgi:outer membrane lipoprotein-sorting protein
MRGWRQAVVLAAALPWLVGNATLRAEVVPLPRPAPMPKEVSPAAVQSTAPNPSAPPSTSNPIDSFLKALNPLGSRPSKPATDPSTFDARQQLLLGRVSAYLTGVQNLSANFVQTESDGRRSTGRVYMQKPGKMRLEYDPPNPTEIVADGTEVAVRDRQAATGYIFSLAQTPLRFLLADKVDLLQDARVVAVTGDDLFVTISIEQTDSAMGANRLTMKFGAKDFTLKQWTISDAQGFDTTIAVSKLDSTKSTDPNLFRIDYTREMQ